ncbi:type III PLP-dependent enzyme [Streptomyces sp. OF3]|uniref:Type III PLP-dependent enzyme n=1 Tax=Streptomyces alkaliterrae TaxID=2213162 RepID=A0A5P0YQR1_9ACTN|nr:type III PLP-dependent enzyme [Streptomyces alkaliterrae]MBB1259105.1 type III PLP-dependent enzyme [Streptomyces alkaliterrae]MQS02250.1 type III PLP-dependent enzyme [Streptomyces alkaliterrae]
MLATYGSPLYVYDLRRVRAALADLRSSLPQGAHVLYSLKANPHVDLVRELLAGGCRAELSSTGELRTALAAGADPATCFYTGPGKTAEELRTAIAAGVRTFSTESLVDLRRVARVARESGQEVDCVLRVNGAEAPGSAGMRMTGDASQFGTDAVVLAERGEELRDADLKGARLVGFHFFPLTNAADEASLVAEMTASIRTAAALAEQLALDITVLDLGGGFGAPFAQTGDRPRYPGLRKALAAELDRHFPRWADGGVEVLFESGRHLVGDSGTLLCTVSDVKDSRDTRFAVLDTGINHLGGLSGIGRLLPLSAVPLAVPTEPTDEATHDAQGDAPDDAPVELGTDAAATPPARTRLVGPLCTPADTLGRGAVDLPDLAVGQRLAIPNVGAYGATASLLGFLSRPAAAEVVVDGPGSAESPRVVSATRLTLVREPVPARTTDPTEHPEPRENHVSEESAMQERTMTAVPVRDAEGGPWNADYVTVLRSVLPRLGEDVGPDTSLRAAGLDSLALVELLVRLEEAYAVAIPDDDLGPESFATAGSLWSVVESVRTA